MVCKAPLPVSILAVLYFFIVLAGCPSPAGESPSEPPIEPPASPTYVYFGGYEHNGTRNIATIWKVNENNLSDVNKTTLENNSAGQVIQDMEIVGNDIHSLVSITSSPYGLRYYRNQDMITQLPESGASGQSMRISDGKTYIFGSVSSTDTFYLWVIDQEGVTERFTVDTGNYAAAGDMIIEGDAIYLCGQNMDAGETGVWSYIWKGSLSNLANGFTKLAIPDSSTRAMSIGLSYIDGTLLVCGKSYSAAVSRYLARYWRIRASDMVITDTVGLAQTGNYGSFLDLVEQHGDVIHAIGYENTVNGTAYYRLKYWRDGVSTDLTSGDGFCGISDMCVTESSVYAAGYERVQDPTKLYTSMNDVARFWVNGVSHDLTLPSVYAAIRCIEM